MDTAPRQEGPVGTEDYGYSNEPVPEQPDYPRTRSPKRGVRMRSVEETYGALVKAGLVRIVRKKGRAPRIIWL